MNKNTAIILHSLVRYPIILIRSPFIVLGMISDFISNRLEIINCKYGAFLLKKIRTK